MKVPLSKPYVDEEIRAAVLRALDSGKYILGPECESFEAEFAKLFGAAHAVLTSSGTAAIQLALEARGVRPGDEIIVPSLTAFPTIEPILHLGAVPVFAEIDETFTMDPRHAASLVTSKTVGILPVHLYGHPANLTELQALAARRKLFLMEDACQGHGARIGDRWCGSIGLAGCFSFYPSKNMTVAGDGGMVTTSDGALAEKIRVLRNHGRRGRYEHEVAGYNLRFNEIQAAVGRIQLRHLPDFVAKRRAAASKYRELLSPLGGQLSLPSEAPWARHAFHLYVVRTPLREDLRRFLAEAGVASEVHYPIPCHRQPAVLARMKTSPLPFTERACAEILSLPLFPSIEEAELAYVAEKAKAFFSKKRVTAP